MPDDDKKRDDDNGKKKDKKDEKKKPEWPKLRNVMEKRIPRRDKE